MPQERKGRNGGTLRSRAPGDPQIPGAGKKKGTEHSTTRLRRLFEFVKNEKNKATGEQGEFTLLELADAAIFDKALSGDVLAYRELLDRFEGKVPQRNEHSGPDSGPIQFDTNAPLADKLAALEALKKIQNKGE